MQANSARRAPLHVLVRPTVLLWEPILLLLPSSASPLFCYDHSLKLSSMLCFLPCPLHSRLHLWPIKLERPTHPTGSLMQALRPSPLSCYCYLYSHPFRVVSLQCHDAETLPPLSKLYLQHNSRHLP